MSCLRSSFTAVTINVASADSVYLLSSVLVHLRELLSLFSGRRPHLLFSFVVSGCVCLTEGKCGIMERRCTSTCYCVILHSGKRKKKTYSLSCFHRSQLEAYCSALHRAAILRISNDITGCDDRWCKGAPLPFSPSKKKKISLGKQQQQEESDICLGAVVFPPLCRALSLGPSPLLFDVSPLPAISTCNSCCSVYPKRLRTTHTTSVSTHLHGRERN